jgi:AmmeMemoRadiSam system protein B/AmmeMemoRadiSam system protein A
MEVNMAIKKWGILLIMVLMLSSFCLSEKNKTRDYLTTGGWYPRSPGQLNAMLDGYFSKAKAKNLPGKITAIVAPHAGFRYSGQCATHAYKYLENPAYAGNIQRVILLGVSHSSSFHGAAVSTFDYNATPLGNIPVDTAVTKALAEKKLFKVSNRIMQYEHSLENQLPFLQKALKNQKFKIVPILFSHLDRKDFKYMAGIIKEYIDEKTLVVASTDINHYGSNFGYTPLRKERDLKSALTRLDMGIIKPIARLDFDGYYEYKRKTGITICGFTPVGVLIEIFADNKHTGMLMDYCKSGDRNNDYSHSVSYASVVICEGGKKGGKENVKPPTAATLTTLKLSPDEQKVLLSIARDTLEKYLEKGKVPEDLEKKYKLSKNLEQTTGVFVTLKTGGHLRGCIGSIVGVAPLYLGVRDNAIKAAVKDYRFKAVQKKELEKIDIEISVMTPLQRIEDYKKIRLGTDGVIIRKGHNRAVYLPQVATETGWNLDRFLGRLCQKAGLPPRSYAESKDMEFYIFQANVFHEPRGAGSH